ncbi:MAG: hypothetical protein ACREI3_03970 [Nitrospirales bacterium]
MKTILTAIGILVAFACWSSFAFAQMLPPKHPGYPMDKAVSPVTGQPLANDPGQTNAMGDDALAKGAAFADSASEQNLEIPTTDQRILESPGAGRLPKVQGPQIKIEPPVKEATRMPQ